MNVRSLLVTNTQSAKLTEPGECSLYHPTPSPQAAAMRRVALRQQRQNVAGTKGSTDCLGIVSAVTHDAPRTTSRSS